jgi:hypothetical protein
MVSSNNYRNVVSLPLRHHGGKAAPGFLSNVDLCVPGDRGEPANPHMTAAQDMTWWAS